MKLELNCPECGYNSYKVTEISSNIVREVQVSKCDGVGCDIDIDNIEHEHYDDFSELVASFNIRFKIIEVVLINCVS